MTDHCLKHLVFREVLDKSILLKLVNEGSPETMRTLVGFLAKRPLQQRLNPLGCQLSPPTIIIRFFIRKQLDFARPFHLSHVLDKAQLDKFLVYWREPLYNHIILCPLCSRLFQLLVCFRVIFKPEEQDRSILLNISNSQLADFPNSATSVQQN